MVRLNVKYSTFLPGSKRGVGTRVNFDEGITQCTFLYRLVRKSSLSSNSLILSALKYLFSSAPTDLISINLFLIESRRQNDNPSGLTWMDNSWFSVEFISRVSSKSSRKGIS